MIQDLSILLVFHFIFDFLLQSRKTANKKSSDMKVLIGHLFSMMFGILLAGLFFTTLNQKDIFVFAIANTALHGIIDWNIWRIYKGIILKKYPDVANGKIVFEYWNDKLFYSFIGLDQLLHTLCYLLTYKLIKG